MKYYDEKSNEWIDIRDTGEYKSRKKQLKDVWIIVLAVMAFMPLGAQIGIALIATLASLCYLDEVPYAVQRSNEEN